ncbi:MAG: NAD(P)/FAD-dependent oxidoreductase [Myxococcaceae bacterium]|nr:NAD(P)/FAD-dependent oxidoreductase [Myxococcaceae bacterium]
MPQQLTRGGAYDAVVIGAGHNGLTCACYLARAGLRVLVLEQYGTVGGMTLTEQLAHPGFLSDVHASGYLVAKLSPAPAELRLVEHGLTLITPNPNWAHVFSDGRCVTIGRTVEETARSVARFSARDAEAWRSLYARYVAAKPDIVAAMNATPPSLAVEYGRPEAVDDYRFEFQTARSWVDETFESPEMRAFFGSFSLHASLAPDDACGGQFAWLFLSSVQDVGVSIVKGGMQQVTLALAKVLRELGGEVRTGARVSNILVEGGKAVGVRLESGETVSVDGPIAANVDPQHLVLELLGQDVVGPEVAGKIRRYAWGESFFTLHVALDQPVAYRAGLEPSQAGYVHAAPPSLDALAQMFVECRGGLLPARPLMGIINESVMDPTRAPPGKALMKFVVHYVPYHVRGDATGRVRGTGWDAIKDAYADALLEWLDADFLPGLRKHVIARAAQSPLDLEWRLPSAVHGTHQHGAFLPYQVGAMRPIPEMGQYRLPVPNIYLCGAGAHPGSGVSMMPGRNAAQVICRDLGLDLSSMGER